MRLPRIYSDQDLAVNTQVVLEEAASRHLCQVLRCKAGQPLVLFNGRGGEYSAVLEQADHRACRVSIDVFDPVNRESPLKIHLGLALSKGDRFDWALQKSTELGVFAIYPLLTERTEMHLTEERMSKKMLHWERLISSSCEQSQRNVPPQLHNPLSLEQWLSLDRQGACFFLQPGAEISTLVPGATPVESAHLAIGPEGGFSQAEYGLALARGFVAMPLGPRILRTETAPVAAISVLQWLWGDLH
jgi:16S rRNA (uracil1498-N3)-methyltransferase